MLTEAELDAVTGGATNQCFMFHLDPIDVWVCLSPPPPPPPPPKH
jgi:hypothetical protein